MKKPKVWDIAGLSGIALIVIMILMLRGRGQNALLINYVLIAYFACAISMLIYAFFRQLKYNIYSYNTIYYMGFALFVLFLLISHIRLAVLMAADPDSYSMFQIVSNLQGSARTYIFMSFPFILIFSAALCVSNISLIRHEGRRLVNLLGIILSVLMIGGELFLYFSSYYMSGSAAHVLRLELASQLLTTIYLYCECMLIGAIVADIIAAFHVPSMDRDYIIVLGCGFRDDGTPTPLLKGRLDKALEFYGKQKETTGRDAVFVTSGGQGPDEVMPESTCMKNYLVAQGIPADRVIEEDKSNDTFENMKFSKEKLIEAGCDIQTAKVAFATTNYHVFRSGLYAKRVKMQAEGMGADTKWYFWPNASIRELVGLMTEHRGKQALVLGSMIVIYAALTIVTFTH